MTAEPVLSGNVCAMASDAQLVPAGRNPLMSAERKSALEVPLHREGVGLHEPGAVLILRAEQERHAFAVRLVGRGHARDVQRKQRESGRVGIRFRAGELRPAAARLPAARESR